MDQKLQWMYEGPKSTVNRDDYLLGKRIDKNFELYSDVVVRNKDDERTQLFAQKPGSSTEGLPVMVVRQEDPLAQLKIQEAKRRQAMLENPALKMKAERVLRREFEKMQKKEKHKNKRRKRESSDQEPEPKSRSPPRRRRSSSRSPRRDRRSPPRPSSSRRTPPKVSPDRRRGGPRSSKAEEMDRKRREMVENAEWKQKVRQENVQFARRELEKETADSNDRTAAFIKAFKQRTEGSTVAERIQSKRGRLRPDLDD